MAARLRVRHQDDIRQKIKAALLVKRLEDHVLKDTDLSKSQVSAALGLLKKVIPDLQATQISGDEDAPVRVEFGWSKPSA